MNDSIRSQLSSKVYNATEKYSNLLSVPHQRNLRELLTGILLSGSSHLSQIGEKVASEVTPRKNTERLSHALEKIDSETLQQRHISSVAYRFRGEPLLLLADGGDFQKPHAQKMEELCSTVDGSNGHRVGKGYPTFAVVAYGLQSQKQVPLAHHLYSTKEEDFQSAWKEEQKVFSSLSAFDASSSGTVHDRIIVEDRGGDDIKRFLFFREELQMSFLTRVCAGTKSRHLIDAETGERYSAQNLGKRLRREAAGERSWYNQKRKEQMSSRIAFREVRLPGKQELPLFLVLVYTDDYEEPMVFLTDIAVRDTAQAWKVFFWYKKRWEVENFFRGIKQHFAAEGFLIRSLSKIKTLAFLFLLAYALLLQIQEKVQPFLGVLFQEFLRFCRRWQRSKESHHDLLHYLRDLFSSRITSAPRSYRSWSLACLKKPLPPDSDQLPLFSVAEKW